MTTDLVGSIWKLLGAQSSTASALLGESEEGTRAGLRAIVPALVASLVSRGADTRGARDLLGRLASGSVDAGLPGNLASQLASRGGFEALLGSGQGLLGFLIGDRTQHVSETVARLSGIKSSSASALLGMAAPVLFSFLKRHVMDGGLDAGGLKSLLMSQTPLLQKMDLDPRLTGAMGIHDLQEVLGMSDRDSPDSEAARPTAGGLEPYRERRWIGWALGLIGAALVAGVSWSLLAPAPNRRVAAPAPLPYASPNRTSVYFDPGSTALDADDWKVIEWVAATARTDGRAVVLSGAMARSDDGGGRAAFVEQRVAAVRDGLIAKGVADRSIVIQPPRPEAEASPRVQIDLRAAP